MIAVCIWRITFVLWCVGLGWCLLLVTVYLDCGCLVWVWVCLSLGLVVLCFEFAFGVFCVGVLWFVGLVYRFKWFVLCFLLFVLLFVDCFVWLCCVFVVVWFLCLFVFVCVVVVWFDC